MVKLKESLTRAEKELRQKEVDLAAIRASEEQEARESAVLIKALEDRVTELEDAIKAQDKAAQERTTELEEAATAERERGLADLEASLRSCREELAEHVSRANGAEVLIWLD